METPFLVERPKLGNSTAKKVLDSTTDSEVKAEIKGSYIEEKLMAIKLDSAKIRFWEDRCRL